MLKATVLFLEVKLELEVPRMTSVMFWMLVLGIDGPAKEKSIVHVASLSRNTKFE